MRKTVKSVAPAKRLPLPIGNSDWAAVRNGYWSAGKPEKSNAGMRKKR